ncbi:nucleolar complex protein 14 [Marasmius tenuissimus]|uniref:Nucleolar complex protein 14 n=1 Tax=Marasmius tenuissimus TaxID=585030 RepID=A0ABR3A9X9_9AGAR
MAKGSQLAQLKSALSQAGISGNDSKSRKRKRSAPTEKDKEKRATKLDEIHRRLNPFDEKVTKLKHDVGGRKLKGVTGKPAQSKMAGIEQRKKTLLKELEERGRAGGILDRRFGENDPAMSLEERMLERFTRERQRASKGSAFNLEDEDELTHYGQSLSNMDDFDNTGLGLEDDDEDEGTGRIDQDVVKHTHFGGFDEEEEDEDDENEEPARKKSKAEVMAEVIAKSKEHKMLRQMDKEKGDDLRHELDQGFDSIRDLLFAAPPEPPNPSSSGSNSIPLGIRDDTTLFEDKKTEDYDQNVKALMFEKRAKPKDRTKTEEELALEEKESLEKAEKQRRKRMLGLDDSDSEDEGKKRKKRPRGGDDLEDDFDDQDIDYAGLGAGLAEVDGGSGSEEDEDMSSGSEEDEEDDGDEEVEGEWGGISDAESADSAEDDGGGDESLVEPRKKPKPSKVKQSTTELPYTFPCPSSHDEFLDIVENVADEDIPTVVKRIRALYHSSLAPENKSKLQALNSVLIDHILYVVSPPNPRFRVTNLLLPHLYALTRAYPIQSAEHFIQKLTIMHRNLKRGLSKGPSNFESKTWPGLPELTLFQIIGAAWPTSDMNHIVISPTRILMSSYLGLCRIRSLMDVSSGLFLCTLFLQFEQLSKRYVPETINFLLNIVLHLAPSRFKDAAELPGAFPAPDFRSDHCQSLAIGPKKLEERGLRRVDLARMLVGKADEHDKLDLLALALELLSRFAELYKGLEAFIEIFDPVMEVLKGLQVTKLGKAVQTSLTSTTDALGRLLKFALQSRRPLMLQAHKPIPIPSYVPKFDSTSSSYLRAQDPDKERKEASKLRNEYKKERKGAIRELRKDAKFLAGVEQAKQKDKDRSYNESMKKAFSSIESERAEQKSMEREKAKAKRRAGK